MVTLVYESGERLYGGSTFNSHIPSFLIVQRSSRLSGNDVDSITTATVHLVLLTARGTSLATL